MNGGKGTVGKAVKDEDCTTHAVTLVNQLDGTLEKISAGQGTMGQLLVNPQLYESLNDTAREAQGLVKDIRANPKKFLTIR